MAFLVRSSRTEAGQQGQSPLCLIDRQGERIRPTNRFAVDQLLGQVHARPLLMVVLGPHELVHRYLVVGHMHLQVSARLIFRPGGLIGLEHDLAQERRHGRDLLHGGAILGPQTSPASHLDIGVFRHGQVAGQAIAHLDLARA